MSRVAEVMLRTTLVTLHSILWLRDSLSRSISWLWLAVSSVAKHKGDKSDQIAADVKALRKMPRHLALVIQEDSISCDDLAHVTTWAFASNIHLVSIYDPHGNVMRDLTRLRNKVQSSVQRLFNSPLPDIQVYSSQEAATAAVAAGPAQSHAHHQDEAYRVVVLTQQDGQHSVVQAAAGVCQQALERGVGAEQVDTTMLHHRITSSVGVPDPEVALVFGAACSLVGYPPWHLRLTEIHTIPTHHKVTYQQFLCVLHKYSSCQQRVGK